MLAAATALAVVAAGCGDDDDSPDTDAAGADTEAFCELARTLDEQDDFPSIEQLEQYRDLAPAAIKDEATQVAEAFIAATEADDVFAAFDDPAVEEAFEVIEPWEEEECGIDHGEDEPDQDPSVTELDPAATRVDVLATDYAFAFDPPSAGRTSFVMTNEGAERHVMFLFRAAEGFTVEQVLAADGEEGTEEEYESDTVTTGGEAVLTADLVPGEYGMICYIPTADGQSHYELGMQETFTVS